MNLLIHVRLQVLCTILNTDSGILISIEYASQFEEEIWRPREESILFLMSLNRENCMRVRSNNLEVENRHKICLKAEENKRNLHRDGQNRKECAKSTP
jgi:hypothetical protein